MTSYNKNVNIAPMIPAYKPIIVPAPTLPDSGNPNVAWLLETDVQDIVAKPVAYKTFEGLVKIPGFSLEIEWDFRF